ncbi:YGGT domain protein [Streptococcus anginosus SK1138]|uniref:YGGT domain protein n=1 Tax=Streptococcus anginosus SK1138 TaxID=1161422 RepID=A0AAD2Y9U9_STRAP|nr:YGGT domain protein [Streptococcus anginosus SK1138]
MKPFQRFNLQFAGIDWTVLVVIFLLNFVSGIILNALLLLA